MIEQVLREFLDDKLDVPVFVEYPKQVPYSFVVIEKEGSQKNNKLHSGLFAFQSYGKTMYEAASLNEKVKKAIDKSIWLEEIAKVQINSDYNYTDTGSKEYRYQAVYDISYYDSKEVVDSEGNQELEEAKHRAEGAEQKLAQYNTKAVEHELVFDGSFHQGEISFYPEKSNIVIQFFNQYSFIEHISNIEINGDQYDVNMSVTDGYKLEIFVEQELKEYNSDEITVKIWITDHPEYLFTSTLGVVPLDNGEETIAADIRKDNNYPYPNFLHAPSEIKYAWIQGVKYPVHDVEYAAFFSDYDEDTGDSTMRVNKKDLELNSTDGRQYFLTMSVKGLDLKLLENGSSQAIFTRE